MNGGDDHTRSALLALHSGHEDELEVSRSLWQLQFLMAVRADEVLCRQIDHCEDLRFGWIAEHQHHFVQFDLGRAGPLS